MNPAVERRLRRAIDQLSPLPVLQGTVIEVRALAEDPDASTDAVVAAIERDEAFAANLLRFANSAAVSRPVRARTVRQAVTLAGRRVIARLAVEAATYRFLERVPGTGRASRGQLHVHAITAATIGVGAAQRAGATVETVHLAALLHDVGKLVLPLAFGEEALDEIARLEPAGSGRARLERERLDVDHAHAGALLVESSNIPADIVEPIRFHHGGRSGPESPSREAACVQLANTVAGLITGGSADDELVHVALARAGFSLDALDDLAQLSLPASAPVLEGSLAAKVRELERLATIDDLTGLSNRRHWLAEVRARLAAEQAGGVLICDIDDFKAINDRHGHRFGDLVLGEVARILGRHGFAGRLGGDEFAVWTVGGQDETLAAANAALRDVLDDVVTAGEGRGTVALSIGAALAPRDGTGITALLETADAALYQAKAAGRRRVQLAGA
jgi:diguanylate cyclase (GGDEF)-like protein/putative nucleotidyltransferase with HDIG domain